MCYLNWLHTMYKYKEVFFLRYVMYKHIYMYEYKKWCKQMYKLFFSSRIMGMFHAPIDMFPCLNGNKCRDYPLMGGCAFVFQYHRKGLKSGMIGTGRLGQKPGHTGRAILSSSLV